jgi:hypothetical protein
MLEPVSLKERKDIRCMAGFLGLELSSLLKMLPALEIMFS